MAVVPPNDPNQPNPNQPQSNGIGMGQTPANPAQPKGSGRFTNLQKYVSANQGAGEKIGNRIGSQVEGQAGQVRQGIQQAKTGFQQQIDPEKQRIAGAEALTQEALGNTQQFVNDPTKFNQFQQLRNAQTAQINPLELQQQQLQAQKAQQMAANANTEQGRFQLLKGAFANPRYTTGLGRLDQLFLQSSPALKQLQQQSKATTQGLGGELDATRAYSQQELAGLQDQAKVAQQGIQTAVGREDDPTTPEDESSGAFGGLSKDLFGRLGTKQQELDTQYQNILNRFDAIPNQDPSGIMGKASPDAGTHKAANLAELYQNLNKDEKGLLGLNDDMLMGNMSPDEFKSYLRKKQLGNQERARFINADEYGKYQGLGKLMGVNTQQTLAEDEKALLGKGLGEYGLTAKTQLDQELQGREAGLWGGGYLNDMPGVIQGYQNMKNLANVPFDVNNASQYADMPAEVYMPAVQKFLADRGIDPNARDPYGRQIDLGQLGSIAQASSRMQGYDVNNPELIAQMDQKYATDFGNTLRDTQKSWREGQIKDRARNAGMLQTLGGRELSADELYNRYQTFKNKGLI